MVSRGSSPSVGAAGAPAGAVGQTTRHANTDVAAATAITIVRRDGRSQRPTTGAPTLPRKRADSSTWRGAAGHGGVGGSDDARRGSSGAPRGGGGQRPPGAAPTTPATGLRGGTGRQAKAVTTPPTPPSKGCRPDPPGHDGTPVPVAGT
ncbi:hypothetical protein I4F81_009696 [Pyropia yezoensis]|uniref:Uncharacterized protein n=1 Tax=Pyropia yezoensis TaxID=2788 RepID=A0ACC3CB64_PYRYE|nr:hypothetical protein I4F81_009696 [Neopyropia yezoensis]